ncbi:Astacin-like metalloprotease toxin 1, partial [Araneus ventricosus]
RQQDHNGRRILLIPYVIRDEFNRSLIELETIQRAMRMIEHYSPVRFIRRTNEECCLTITKGEGCSYSGVGGNSCLATISLGRGCEGYGTVLHELLHALGFQHEQQRPDRDDFIIIYEDYIIEEEKGQFEISEDYRWHDFPFDYDSNMMYDSYAFSKDPQRLPTITTKNGKIIPRNDYLSDGDIRKLLELQKIVNENGCIFL